MKINAKHIFNINNTIDFNNISIEIFKYQQEKCTIYKRFLNLIKFNNTQISDLKQIPFLPVEFFKNHTITTYSKKPTKFFRSSGTTAAPSKHFYNHLNIYQKSFGLGFNLFYGKPANYAVLALLPSYSQNSNSSLIYMVNALISESNHNLSGFYNNNFKKLFSALQKLKSSGTNTILFGVSYALLDFCTQHPIDFPELTVIETGGMKGRKKEMIRTELHNILCKGFNVNNIHSEYGMTELFSQAYAKEKGLFKCPPWMKVFTRDINDPFSINNSNKAGALNIIDLANLNSCSFIATQDIGTVFPDGSFTVEGRLDNSEMRGCNLIMLK